MPNIVHCKHNPYDVYIGRPTKWGNPFEIGQDGDRTEVIDKHTLWLEGKAFLTFQQQQRRWVLENLYQLKGKILGCWCAPKPCHGDTLARLAANTLPGSSNRPKLRRQTMKEATGNLWEADTKFIKCITTNGIVKRNGELVMGRGNTLQAAQRFPQLPHILGSHVKTSGNMVYYLEQFNIASFPVKHNWRDKADIELIKKSCHQLNAMLDNLNRLAVLPRPGCSNGRLDWDREVKPVISQILSDRVWVINFNITIDSLI